MHRSACARIRCKHFEETKECPFGEVSAHFISLFRVASPVCFSRSIACACSRTASQCTRRSLLLRAACALLLHPSFRSNCTLAALCCYCCDFAFCLFPFGPHAQSC